MGIAQNLLGKTAIITGASSGIGQATAVTLARAGAAVVLHARRQERLQAVAAEITAAGGHALVVAGDATRAEDLDRLVDATLAWEEGGRKLDIAVVNAGRGLSGSLLTSDEAQWETVYQINVLGAARLMRRAAQRMVEQKSGDIVVIGSVVGRHISPVSGVYGSTKFAVEGLAEGLRREVCSQGVRVSLVMPGVLLSGFQEVAGYDPSAFNKWASQFGKLLEPQAIADGIAWLLSLPPEIHVSDITIRPTGQAYP